MTPDLERAARAVNEARRGMITLSLNPEEARLRLACGNHAMNAVLAKAALRSLSEPSDEVVERVARDLSRRIILGDDIWLTAELKREVDLRWPDYADEAREIISTFIKAVTEEQ